MQGRELQRTMRHRSMQASLAFGMAWALVACGGSGGADNTPSVVPGPSGGGGNTTGQLGGGSMAGLVAWRTSLEGIYRQGEGEPNESFMVSRGGVSTLQDLATSTLNGDSFVMWSLGDEPRSHNTHFETYSALDIQRQRSAPTCNFCVPLPLRSFSVEGSWSQVALSSDGRYAAGPWATNNLAMESQALLAIVDLQAPAATAEGVFQAPGGASEKVDVVQWIGPMQFLVRNKSGRKFRWTVGTNEWLELPAPPPGGFNGYTRVSEIYAPDGLKYAGLMSKDGGKTHEVWVSNFDYSDMRQLTNAGLKLSYPQWLGDSHSLLFNFDTASGVRNRCGVSVLNPEAASMLNAPQVAALTLPENLHCSFQASLVK